MAMTPINNKAHFLQDGTKLETLTLDPLCFMFNTIAMGDAIAGVPVVKHMVENYYTDPDSYYVVAKSYYRCLFPFVPDYNFRDYDVKDNLWNMPPNTVMSLINKKNEAGVTRITPKHMHLGQFASVLMTSRLLTEKQLQYVPLDEVDVSHFGIDFTNCVVLVTSYRDPTRRWYPEYILEVALWLKANGFNPLFVGKTDMDQNIRPGVVPKNSLPEDVSAYGTDLRNKTTIPELASIFRQAKAVCGLDSGPIHLAGTTSVPIVCGYTSVSPENRIPYRSLGETYPITPSIECIGCESRWQTIFWNFENCYHEHAECCKQMTADKFINVLRAIL